MSAAPAAPVKGAPDAPDASEASDAPDASEASDAPSAPPSGASGASGASGVADASPATPAAPEPPAPAPAPAPTSSPAPAESVTPNAIDAVPDVVMSSDDEEDLSGDHGEGSTSHLQRKKKRKEKHEKLEKHEKHEKKREKRHEKPKKHKRHKRERRGDRRKEKRQRDASAGAGGEGEGKGEGEGEGESAVSLAKATSRPHKRRRTPVTSSAAPAGHSTIALRVPAAAPTSTSTPTPKTVVAAAVTVAGGTSVSGSPPPSSSPVRLQTALFDPRFEAFNRLVDSNFNRDKQVSAVVIPYTDLMRVIKTLGAMKLTKAHCWMVKDYIPPCDVHLEEATEVKCAVHCGKPSGWVLKVDGHFVCDAHKPADEEASSRVTMESAFSGLMVVGTNQTNMAIKAHIPGFIEGRLGALTDFDIGVQAAKKLMAHCWEFREPTCQDIRIAITEDEELASKLVFSPLKRRTDSKRVSGLMVDNESMRRFPVSLGMPQQMNADTSVTMMLSIPLLVGFHARFSAETGSEVELTVDQLKCKVANHRVLGKDTELLSFTFRGGLDSTVSVLDATRSFYSATQVIKTEATPSAVDASVGFAVTRVSRMTLDRAAIARMLMRNQADFEPVSLVRTQYARDNLVNAMNIVLHEFNSESILLFTGRDEQTPLVFSHSLPKGGILLITLGVAVPLDEE